MVVLQNDIGVLVKGPASLLGTKMGQTSPLRSELLRTNSSGGGLSHARNPDRSIGAVLES